MIKKELIEKDIEIGLCEIEKRIHGINGYILRIWQSHKYWHVVYKQN